MNPSPEFKTLFLPYSPTSTILLGVPTITIPCSLANGPAATNLSGLSWFPEITKVILSPLADIFFKVS